MSIPEPKHPVLGNNGELSLDELDRVQGGAVDVTTKPLPSPTPVPIPYPNIGGTAAKP